MFHNVKVIADFMESEKHSTSYGTNWLHEVLKSFDEGIPDEV